MCNILKLFCFICAASVSESARILAVYPAPSISHQVAFRPLMHELAKRGHDVVVITTDPAFPKGNTPQNLTEIDVHDLSYKQKDDLAKTGNMHGRFSYKVLKNFLDLMLQTFEAQIQAHDVQTLINDKNRKFDLLFVEACVRPALSFAYLYNVPVIEFSSYGPSWRTFDHTGVPTNPLVYPLPVSHRIYNLTLWEKILALYNDYDIHKVFKEAEILENELVRRLFGPNIPALSELKKNVQMTFLNVHPIWDFNRPVPPNVVYLGGIHQKPSKKLPQGLHQRIHNLQLWGRILALYNDHTIHAVSKKVEIIENKVVRKLFGPALSELRKNVQIIFLNVYPLWDFKRPVLPSVVYLGGMHQQPTKEVPKDIKSYLDSSKNGVIYVSFGSNAKPSLLPPEKLSILKSVFSKLPYDVLWKYDEEELPGLSENVKLSKWLPQSDLLRHPKVKLFITQGGLQSTDEALAAGVPLVVIPFLGDQWFNAEQYVKLKIGIYVDMDIITETKLKGAIEKVIGDKTYRENVVKLHSLMHDQPQSPLERAVWWTEHVLRHGGAAHLRAAAAHMHWTEYYALDLVLLVLTVSLVLFIGIALAVRFVIIKLQLNYLRIKIKKN